jgi:hypothetical protein
VVLGSDSYAAGMTVERANVAGNEEGRQELTKRISNGMYKHKIK